MLDFSRYNMTSPVPLTSSFRICLREPEWGRSPRDFNCLLKLAALLRGTLQQPFQALARPGSLKSPKLASHARSLILDWPALQSWSRGIALSSVFVVVFVFGSLCPCVCECVFWLGVSPFDRVAGVRAAEMGAHTHTRSDSIYIDTCTYRWYMHTFTHTHTHRQTETAGAGRQTGDKQTSISIWKMLQ